MQPGGTGGAAGLQGNHHVSEWGSDAQAALGQGGAARLLQGNHHVSEWGSDVQPWGKGGLPGCCRETTMSQNGAQTCSPGRKKGCQVTDEKGHRKVALGGRLHQGSLRRAQTHSLGCRVVSEKAQPSGAAE